MVNVRHNRCGHSGCTTHPSYGAAGTKKGELCAEHRRDDMVYLKRNGHGTAGGTTSGRGQVGSTRGSIQRRVGAGKKSMDGVHTAADRSGGRSTADKRRPEANADVSVPPLPAASATATRGERWARAAKKETASQTVDAAVKAEVTTSCTVDPSREEEGAQEPCSM